jgi:hypothetical protein
MLFLPLTPLDPRPSIAVFNCLLIQVVLSFQLLLFQSHFSQQNKDTSIIQKEVMHEYDTKYVHPRLHPMVRDVATQISATESGDVQEEVQVGTPAALIRRRFEIHPNPNYAKHIDPDYSSSQQKPRNVMSPSLFTPSTRPRHSDSFTSTTSFRSPGLRQSLPVTSTTPLSSGAPTPPDGNPVFSNTGTMQHGGNLGVFSHVNSPLKKATSMGDMKNPGISSPRNSREMAALEQRHVAERLMRQSSPVKENRRATTQFGGQDQTQSTNPFANTRPNRWTQERFPSRW